MGEAAGGKRTRVGNLQPRIEGDVGKRRLANGIRLVYETIPYAEVASVGFWFDIGSACEDAASAGYTHFIEHMLFKGTPDLSAFEISRRVDEVGGIMNAFTSREHTCFHATVAARHLPMVLSLLGEMYYHSGFLEEELEREKQVVCQEIRMYEDSPEDLLHDMFVGALWPGQAIGNPISGTRQNIEAITRRKIRAFFQANYPTDRLVIAVAGPLPPAALVRLIEGWPERRRTAGFLAPPQIPAPVFTRCLRAKSLEQVHLILGMPGVAAIEDRRHALYLLNLIIGGSMSSRLYQRIREQSGICYSIYSFVSSYRTRGVFGIYCGTSLEFLERVITMIGEELCRLVGKGGIDEAELTRAREQMKGNIVLGRESVEARMNRLGVQELVHGRQLGYQEAIGRIDAVRLQDIRDMLLHIMSADGFAVASLGPAAHKETMKKTFG